MIITMLNEASDCVKLQVVTLRFPNNVNNTHNQSIQSKTECHTTFQV